MKILILSCSTGGGHNSAAHALKDVLTERNIENELIDPIRFKGEKVKNFVSELYNNIIRVTPKLFGFIYKIGRLYETLKLPSPVYYANASYAKELNEYIVENRFDCVVCSHLYGMEAMTAVRKNFHNDIPCYGIVTDYTFIPFTSDTDLDGYFIPHEELTGEALRIGIPKEKVYPCGIPVRSAFGKRISKEEARKKLGLPQDKKIILMMFGSVGCGKIKKVCDEILKKSGEECAAYVIVGKNEKLKEQLNKRYAKNPRVQIVAYTRDVNLYMNAADVFISKSGGLSSTEAAVANVPLVHLKSIPGCETNNALFFASHGMSVSTKKVKEAVIFAKELMYNEEKAESMRAAQRKTVNPAAAIDIVEKITSL